MLLILGTSTCAHKVRIVTDPPGALITVDGAKIGTSPTVYEESPLPGSHVVEACLAGYQPSRLELERSELDWWWIAGGMGGCLLCAGPSCLVGASLANLSLCPACLGCVLTSSPGAMLSILAAPGILTVPLVSLGALIGASPLGLMALSERSPDTVTIQLKK